MKLDLFAHNTMSAALMSREEVAGFASEEEESFIAFDTERARNAKYIILTDPLDGSSNIDVNVFSWDNLLYLSSCIPNWLTSYLRRLYATG